MNVYDFDETIYNGESWIEFLLYCLRKNPKISLYLTRDILSLYKIKFEKNKDDTYDHSYATFLKYVKNIEDMVIDFKKTHKYKIKDWYIKQSKSDDVIISTSPEFFIKQFMEDFNVLKVCGSIIDPKTGVITGTVCHDREKYKRFINEFGNIDYNFYTDDKIADKQMLNNANQGFLVRKNKIIKY